MDFAVDVEVAPLLRAFKCIASLHWGGSCSTPLDVLRWGEHHCSWVLGCYIWMHCIVSHCIALHNIEVGAAPLLWVLHRFQMYCIAFECIAWHCVTLRSEQHHCIEYLNVLHHYIEVGAAPHHWMYWGGGSTTAVGYLNVLHHYIEVGAAPHYWVLHHF